MSTIMDKEAIDTIRGFMLAFVAGCAGWGLLIYAIFWRG